MGSDGTFLSPIAQLAAGGTLWLTGLPCSGKTTLAQRVARDLAQRGHRVEILDGDVLRKHLSRGLGFSKADRHENALRIGWACGMLSRHGVVAIAALVSPYRETRACLRAMLPGFVEIYVKAPIEVCMHRDVKGMYAKAARGEISDFTGVDSPYEEPLAPEIVVETHRYTIDECAALILSRIQSMAPLESAVANPIG